MYKKMSHLKRKKQYSVNIRPDYKYDLVIMTDMGYIFTAIYEDNKFLITTLRNGKVYYEETIHQESIVKWMNI